MDSLKNGYKKFINDLTKEQLEYFQHLFNFGQKPRYLVIGCSDSRVDPAIITKCSPGDIFVVRNVANLVPPYEPDSGYHGTSAAIEFAVCHLEVENILLLGHTECGGIRSFVSDSIKKAKESSQNHEQKDENLIKCDSISCNHNNNAQNISFIKTWMDIIKPLQKSVADMKEMKFDDLSNEISRLSMLQSMQNLMTFPYVRDKVSAGLLTLNAWQFNLASLEMMYYDNAKMEFCNL